MYTIDDLHYNSKGVIQVSSEECFEDLAATLAALESELKNGSKLEQNMFSFFQEEVQHQVAYRDNDVDQGERGPRRLHVIGNLKRIEGDNGLFVRLGISAPGENPLLPALQALYLLDGEHITYIRGAPIGVESDPDRWVYDFTSRYEGMFQGKVRTRLGIRSLSIIPAINEAILSGRNKKLETPEYD